MSQCAVDLLISVVCGGISDFQVITGGQVHILDLAAKLDATADYICKARWGNVDFPPPFGRDATTEEAYIHDLDSKSGASLKLTVLNPKGRYIGGSSWKWPIN